MTVVQVTSSMPDTSSLYNRWQADAGVADDTAKQQPTNESALKLIVEITERKRPMQIVETESLTGGASVSKYRAKRVDNVEEKVNKNKQEDGSRSELYKEKSSVGLDQHSNVADVVTGFEQPPGEHIQVHERDFKDNKPVQVQSQEKCIEQKSDTELQEFLSSSEKEKGELGKGIGCSETEHDSKVTDAANLDRTEESDKPLDAQTEEEEQSSLEEQFKRLSLVGNLALDIHQSPYAQTEAEEQSKLKNESESREVSQAEFPYKEAVEMAVDVGKDGEIRDNETIENGQYRNEHGTPADVGPTTDDDASVTVADVVSGSDHLFSVDGQGEHNDLKDNKPGDAQSQGKYQERKADTEAREYLSPREKEKDELEKGTICSETEINSTGTVASSLAEDRLRQETETAAQTEAEKQPPKLKNESEGHKVSQDIETQAEFPYKETVVMEVDVSKDDEMPDNEIVENEQYRNEHETPTDVGPSTDNDATETVAYVVSELGHLFSIKGQVENHALTDNESVHGQSSENYIVQKSDIEAHKYLSSSEEAKDESAKRISGSEMPLDSKITDSDPAEDSNRALAANEQSNLEEKSKTLDLGVSEFSCNETVKTKVHVNKDNRLVRPSS